MFISMIIFVGYIIKGLLSVRFNVNFFGYWLIY